MQMSRFFGTNTHQYCDKYLTHPTNSAKPRLLLSLLIVILISKFLAPLKSQAQSTSLFLITATNQRGCPKSSHSSGSETEPYRTTSDGQPSDSVPQGTTRQRKIPGYRRLEGACSRTSKTCPVA